MKPADKESIAEWALYIAKKHGLSRMTRSRVAAQARASEGAVSNAYNGMDGLIAEVVRRAVAAREWRVVGEALAMRHPSTKKLPFDVRVEATRALI